MKEATMALVGMACGAFAVGQADPAEAIMLNFDPTMPLSVTSGQTLDVDVFVFGLEAGGQNQVVSAFDFDIDYDENVLNPTNVTFGTGLGDVGALEAIVGFDLAAGTGNLTANVAEVSLLSDSALQALQGDSVTLATLSFSALQDATTSLGVLFGTGQDIKGLNALALSVQVVPLPGAVALMASALGGLGLVAWRRRRTGAGGA